ncbi:MAG: hypothetical protein MMC23_006550 [Stictis urceolatum]|nr:hypothetical protein [Stictis urceolata]
MAFRSIVSLLFASSLATASPLQSRQDSQFSTSKIYTFDSGSLPDGLRVDTDHISDQPLGHTFSSSNVQIADGYLQLKVPGGQTTNIQSAEVSTDDTNILYGSVKTVAILSAPAGTVNGMFFYKSDTQESDIEWVSDPSSQSNQGTAQIWFTNQDANGDGQTTHTSVAPPSDATEAEHEYRLDWTEGNVKFFIDGEQKWETSEDVPSTPGTWLWNNWSNGDIGWSAGPPAEDSIFKIKSITMDYNTA